MRTCERPNDKPDIMSPLSVGMQANIYSYNIVSNQYGVYN